MGSLTTVAEARVRDRRAGANLALASSGGTDGERLYEAFLAGRTLKTREAYSQDLIVFANFMGSETPRQALERLLALSAGEANGMLLAFRAHMSENGKAPATINRRLAAIRSAVKLARTLGLTTWAPEVEGLKAQAYRDTTGPGLKGTRVLLATAEDQDPVKAARDSAIIRLMFDLGLHRGEVATLDVADIELSERRVLVTGKGRLQKEPRTLPEKTAAALQHWLAMRQSVSARDESAVFVGLRGSEPGRRITGRGLYHVIVALGTDAGIKTRPHGLRHASITAALDANGGDVRAVQQHARHANPQTTMRYDDNRRDLAGRIATSLADVL